MKKFRIIALLLALVMVVGLFAGCGNNKDPEQTTDTAATTTYATTETLESTSDTTENTSDTSDTSVSTEPSDADTGSEEDVPVLSTGEYALLDFFSANTMEFAIMTWAVNMASPDDIAYFTGIDDAVLLEKVETIAVTEPAMGSQAFSMVLAKTASKEDAKLIADEMKAKVNPAKWICVCADIVEADTYENWAILVMAETALVEAGTMAPEDLIAAFKTMMETWEAPEEVNELSGYVDLNAPVEPAATEAASSSSDAEPEEATSSNVEPDPSVG